RAAAVRGCEPSRRGRGATRATGWAFSASCRCSTATACAPRSRSTAIFAPTIPRSSRRVESAAGSGWVTAKATRAASTKRRRARKRRCIRRALATIADATGARPVGWLGSGLQETWDTLDLLAAEGCEYVCDWTNDDLHHEPRRRRTAHLGALQPRDQRQTGVRAPAPHRRRVQRHDLPAVRRALSRGRGLGPRHGDRAASLP